MESNINNMKGMDNTGTNGNNESVNSNSKISLAYGLAIIFIIFLAIILSASLMGVFNGFEPYQQLTAAMLSVAATGVITAMLLFFQRKQQEQLNKEQREFQEKQEEKQNVFQVKLTQDQQKFEADQKEKEKQRLHETKIFEEKLSIYQEFLKKLCDVVKDMNITEEEEIELQFQVSYIDMHTEYDSIRDISKQVKEIIRRIRMKEPDRKKILKELLEISDTFHKELYGIRKSESEIVDETTGESPRDETLDNFSYIVEDNVLKYEDLKARTRELKRMIYNHGALQRIYSGTVLFHEYFTTRENRHYIDSKDKIVIDLMPEEDKNQYVVLLCTRQYDPEKTKELVKGIWNEPFNPWSKPHAHIHEIIPFKTPNNEIKEKIEKVLQDVKAYRDEKYSL